MIYSYCFGKIIINGKPFETDVIVFEKTVLDNWWRKKGHELCVADIQAAIENFSPHVMVVGTGKFGMMKILPETISYLESLQINLITAKSATACDKFNQLVNKERVIGAFHLTC